jgi:hypothetical protein
LAAPQEGIARWVAETPTLAVVMAYPRAAARVEQSVEGAEEGAVAVKAVGVE